MKHQKKDKDEAFQELKDLLMDFGPIRHILSPTTQLSLFLIDRCPVTWYRRSSLFTHTGGLYDDAAATRDRRRGF